MPSGLSLSKSLSSTKQRHDIPSPKPRESQGSTHLFILPSVCLWGVQVLLTFQESVTTSLAQLQLVHDKTFF